MEINIKEKMEELVQKIQSDKDILDKFQADPIATLEELVGIDLPNEQLEKLVEGIKAKLTIDKVSGALGGLGNLLNRK